MPDPNYTFAFQPIVDAVARQIVSYEALIRGLADEDAWQVLRQVPSEHLHLFDERARVRAMHLAVRLGIGCNLNLNFLPQCLRTTPNAILSVFEAANQLHLPIDRIILEVTEGEVIDDQANFAELINEYRGLGIKVAIDDFGAGYSGLNLLADFQPDQIKLDMKLIRGIECNGPRQAIVRAISQACLDLGVDVIAEGVETADEYHWLASERVRFFQGYLFGRPVLESLPSVRFPD